MKIARVIGRVVLSKKDGNLPDGFLLIASPLCRSEIVSGKCAGSGVSSEQPNLVVFDALGARQGDLISYVEGAEATAPFDFPAAVDAYNVGIVDFYNYNRNL